MAVHKNLGDSELHETKGAAAASTDQVLTATGSGTTTFKKITKNSIDTSSIKNTNKVHVYLTIDNPISSFTKYVPVPFAATLDAIYGTVDSVPDANMTVSFFNSTETTASGTLSFLSAGTAPEYTSSTSLVLNTFTADSYLKITNSAGVTTCGPFTVCLTFSLI